ncbi:flavodoxin domain-containing protein [Phenylobacterium sp.]|uniref:flavodoxin domain-containing protein n=1 Tax=Phenylobacterium sp. TaxID=1871053 RepID=UPI002C60F934|nr:flavodoxin domain-containing protein [Phenylobacterium sp.]HVI33083.1 flavodoxin domain-containing protein [Phenylobacterium sp.]
MRVPYLQARLAEAVEALAAHDGDLHDALYAAHLRLHTLLPEHFPPGPLREAFAALHAALTKRRPSDPQEASVLDVIRALPAADAERIRRQIIELQARAAGLSPEEPAPETPEPAPMRLSGPVARAFPAEEAPVLVVFGSTEGHTERLAGLAADRLRANGHAVSLVHAAQAERTLDPAGLAGVLVAASIHWGRYQASVTAFARANHAVLNALPCAFLSTSLSAAGVEQPDEVGLEDFVRTFENETLWTPRLVHHAGGAIRRSSYDYFKRLAVTLIARSRGDALAEGGEYDLTDYAALEEFLETFRTAVQAGTEGRPFAW